MRNIRIDMCYDGTRYKGWQRLSSTDNTIQEKMEKTLSRILDEPVTVSASGRTDAGTHAQLQVVNFHCNSKMPCDELLLKLRKYLPEDIGIYSCRNVSERFHARLNAKTKTYRYRIWNSNSPCVFERKYVYIDARSFDMDKMRLAAQSLLGTHDFSAFCANSKMKKSTVRTLHEITIERVNEELVFMLTGNGFLHHMVRIIVGTLLQVGTLERSVDSVAALFGGVLADTGGAVPSCGLCLMEVTY